MTDRLYLRHSTDKQADARQRRALAALLAGDAPAYEDPAASSRVLSLRRGGFKRLLDEAAVGDTIRIADAARLFRSVADIIALRPVLIRCGLHLRVESGLLAGTDLASDDPDTTTLVSVLAAVLEFQRGMIAENTKEGVAAASAAGKTLGRPSALDDGEAVELLKAFHDKGTAVKALARRYDIAPRTVRRIIAAAGPYDVPDDLSALLDGEQAVVADGARDPAAPVADPVIVVDVPGLVVERLAGTPDDAVRQALADGRTIRRGQGYSVRVSAPASVHVVMIEHSATALMQSAAGRKAHRIHSDRVTSVRVTP